MRRVIALPAIAALALTLAPFSGARAQGEPVISITISPQGGTHAGTIQVDATVQVSQESFESLKSVVVELKPPTGPGTYGTFCSNSYAAPSADNQFARVDHVTIKFRWNTTQVPSGAASGDCDKGTNPTLPAGGSLSTNNKYKIELRAETHGFGGQPGTPVPGDTGQLSVSNGPATPGGVKLSHDAGAEAISISWSKNSEPDVSQYRVQECVVDKSSKPCGSEWKTVKDNWDKTSIAFATAGPGIYRYRVAALRPDADGQTMVSDWGTPQSEPTEIEVKDDPPASGPAEPGGGGSGGGETQGTAPPRVETRTVVQPTRRVARAAPQVVQRIVEEEPGYNTELPYGGEGASSGMPLAGDESGGGERAVLIPLATGTLLLVAAMQIHYLSRRAHALEAVPAGSLDGGEWPGA